MTDRQNEPQAPGGRGRREIRTAKEKESQGLLNESIWDKKLLVIDENGKNLGELTKDAALKVAQEHDLDLFVIAQHDGNRPAVAKILDYNKYRFEKLKKEKENLKNQTVVDIRQIQLSPTIQENDLQVRYKQATKFLQDGDKVQLKIFVRGRYQETIINQAFEVMNKFMEKFADISTVESKPLKEGKNILAIIAPVKKKESK
jgi:translation initiation factor IF-3